MQGGDKSSTLSSEPPPPPPLPTPSTINPQSLQSSRALKHTWAMMDCRDRLNRSIPICSINLQHWFLQYLQGENLNMCQVHVRHRSKSISARPFQEAKRKLIWRETQTTMPQRQAVNGSQQRSSQHSCGAETTESPSPGWFCFKMHKGETAVYSRCVPVVFRLCYRCVPAVSPPAPTTLPTLNRTRSSRFRTGASAVETNRPQALEFCISQCGQKNSNNFKAFWSQDRSEGIDTLKSHKSK